MFAVWPGRRRFSSAAILANGIRVFKRQPPGAVGVSDLMGAAYATVYDWLSKGTLPANKIAPFEFACGANYVTEWICANAHLLAVEMPSGRQIKETDVLGLNQHFLEATALLIGFFKGEAGQDETIAELDALMGELGWHRANVERADSPELELFGEMK